MGFAFKARRPVCNAKILLTPRQSTASLPIGFQSSLDTNNSSERARAKTLESEVALHLRIVGVKLAGARI